MTRSACSVALLMPLFLASCGQPDVTAYVAMDQEHSQQLMDQFARTSGLKISTRYDTENQKTVGLVSAILEEANRPRCDVFWNNEIAHTVRLAQRGMLVPYDSPAAAGIPDTFRDPEHRWTGFATRARVFIVNTEMLPDEKDWPRKTTDMLDPKWKGRFGVAQPLTGTTLTHFAALSTRMGAEEFETFLTRLQANEPVWLTSNGATMRHVAEGRIPVAWTDTDDYHVARLKGFPVACVFPDQEEGGWGAMLIPNTVALIKGGPNPENGKKLIDYIVSREVEALLAAARSAQIPVRSDVKPPADPQVLPIGRFRQMSWDPDLTASALDPVSARFGRLFGK